MKRLLALADGPAFPARTGGQRRTAGLLMALAERGWRVTLVHPGSCRSMGIGRVRQLGAQEPSRNQRATTEQGIEIDDIRLHLDAARLQQLAELVVREARGCDAILCMRPWMGRFAAAAREQSPGAPVVLDCHDVEGDLKALVFREFADGASTNLSAAAREAEGFAMDLADGVACTTEEDAARIESIYGFPAERIRVVRNAVDRLPRIPLRRRRQGFAKRLLRLDPCRPVALFLAGGHPPNVLVARAVARRLAAGAPSCDVVIAGGVGWALRNELVPGNVRVMVETWGWRRALLYEAADMTLNPVVDDLPGSDIKVLDSLERGIPVVATSRGVRGFRMEAGVHYYPCDDEWGGALWRVSSDVELQQHLTKNGFAKAAELTWHAESAGLHELLTAAPPRRPRTDAAPDLAAANMRHALAEFHRRTQCTMATPPELIFDLTNGCHLRCTHCYRTYMKTAPTTMPMEVFRRVPPRFYDNARQIDLSGMGEPMLHPKWDEILDFVADGGRRLVTFNTSLTLVDEKRLVRMAELGTWPAVSIDGARRETFETIRAGACHAKVFAALARLGELARANGHPRFHPRVQWVLYRSNFRELAEFVGIAADMGIDEIRVQPLAPHQEGMKELCCDAADPELHENLLAAYASATERGVSLRLHPHLIDHGVVGASAARNAEMVALPHVTLRDHHHYPDGAGCSYPWTQLAIDSAGRVATCCFSDRVMGNLLEQDLNEIWNNFHFARLRGDVNGPKASTYCTESDSAGVCCPRVQAVNRRQGTLHWMERQ